MHEYSWAFMLYVGVSLRQKKYYRLLKLQLHGLFRKGKVSVLIINCNSSHDLNILCIVVVYYVINTKTLLSFRNNSLNNLRFEERACTNFSVPFVCAWSQRHAHNMGNSWIFMHAPPTETKYLTNRIYCNTGAGGLFLRTSAAVLCGL